MGVLEYLSNRDGITVLPGISPAAIAHTIGSVLDDPQRLILPALTRRHIVPDRLRGESVAGNFYGSLLDARRPECDEDKAYFEMNL